MRLLTTIAVRSLNAVTMSFGLIITPLFATLIIFGIFKPWNLRKALFYRLLIFIYLHSDYPPENPRLS
jgi:hypothetical protein